MSSYSTDRPHVARALAAAGVTVGAACLYMHWSSREDASSCREAPVEPLPAPAPAVKTSSPLRAGEPGQLKDDVSSSNLAEVFVRGINKKASRDSILAHFSGAGEIKSLRWTSAPKSERKGYCMYCFNVSSLSQCSLRSEQAGSCTTLRQPRTARCCCTTTPHCTALTLRYKKTCSLRCSPPRSFRGIFES